jgi:hypothetical protein
MFVYLTVCLFNGKSYVGKYEGPESDNYLGSGKLLKRAVQKYGKDNFTRIILERYPNKEDCRSGEVKWIKLLNAVESKLFYNIATGGEGGNTYAGLSQNEMVELRVKLKKRAKREPLVGMVSYLDLSTGLRGSCSLVEFKQDIFKVGAKAKYIYTTPLGNYSSLQIAHREIGIDMSTLSRRCTNPDKVVTAVTVAATDHKLKEHDRIYIGKTFREAGYGSYTVSDIIDRNLIDLQTLNIKK